MLFATPESYDKLLTKMCPLAVMCFLVTLVRKAQRAGVAMSRGSVGGSIYDIREPDCPRGGGHNEALSEQIGCLPPSDRNG